MKRRRQETVISPEHRAKFDAVLRDSIPTLGHIFIRRPGKRPVAHATGVFISVSGIPGLVMADHSLDVDVSGAGAILIGGPGDSELAPLRGLLLRSSAFDPDNQHRVDVAVYRLAPETLAAISPFDPISIDDLAEPAPYLPQRRFAVVGFPNSQTKAIPVTEPIRSGVMMYVARERAPSSLAEIAPWLRPEIHLVLNYQADGAVHSEGHSSAPGLSGVSGGAVFDLGATLDPDAAPKLAGILTHHLKPRRVLIATRIHPIIKGIEH